MDTIDNYGETYCDGYCDVDASAGPLIITLGFVITTALFLPLGRGNLKETIGVQLIAFGCMIVLLSQFSFEFMRQGFPYELPLFTDHVSQLAGVVLFNYGTLRCALMQTSLFVCLSFFLSYFFIC